MSMKRNKWKFSPARKRRPVERAYSPQAKEDEIQIPVEETAEEFTTEAEVLVEEPAAEPMAEPELEAEIEIPAEEPVIAAESAAESEPEAEIEFPAEEAVAAAETEPEPEAEIEVPAEEPAPEAEVLVEEPMAEPEAEIEVPAEKTAPEPVAEVYGEETSAAQELPDYFFDEDDDLPVEKEIPRAAEESIFEEEDSADEFEEELEDELERDIKEEVPVSLYERGSSGAKRGKKKDTGKGKKNKAKKVNRAVVRVGDVIIGDGTPKICVPITGRGKDEIVSQAIDAIAVSPDIVEWRVDYLEEAGGKRDIIDILTALRRVLRDTPLLFTYRTEGEGGYGRVGWSHYAELLEWAACRPEVDMIDVEAMGLDVDTEGLIRIIHGRGTPVIASVHYCGEMPGKKERKEAIRFLKQSGGDIIKIAVTPQKEEDVLDLMVWTRKQSRKMEQPLITMAMGDIGKVSRVSGRLTGSAVTFGSVGEMSAAGQIPAEELRTILKQI